MSVIKYPFKQNQNLELQCISYTKILWLSVHILNSFSVRFFGDAVKIKLEVISVETFAQINLDTGVPIADCWLNHSCQMNHSSVLHMLIISLV
jgi:hypothetical protein